MLTLSLVRGFSLHCFVLRTYKPQRRGRPRPRLQRNFFRKDDLLEEAKKLVAIGHTTAAAMTARVEIERLLTALALTRDDFGDYWRGIHRTTSWLNDKNVIRNRTFVIVVEATAVGNLAAHGGEVTKDALTKMFGAIESLRASIIRKGGAA